MQQGASCSGKPLVVVGSVNADLVLNVEQLPKPGETIGASSMLTFPGGKGANQAAAAAKLGYPTYFLGQVGEDANAEMLKAALHGCGVNLEHLKHVPGPCGTALILLQPSGENSIIIVGGANQAEWHLDAAAEQVIRSAGALLLQREIPESVNIAVAQAARAAGVPVFLDAGGVAAPISPKLLSSITLLSPNETELSRLTGLPTETTEQVVEAAGRLQELGVQSVLVKLGAAGSLLTQRGEHVLPQNALPAGKVVDTTGAGDCFTAAYTVAALEGKSPKEALQFASAAACLCVQRPGALPSMPSRAEVDLLLTAASDSNQLATR